MEVVLADVAVERPPDTLNDDDGISESWPPAPEVPAPPAHS
jgi:hypothetical protein